MDAMRSQWSWEDIPGSQPKAKLYKATFRGLIVTS